MLRGGRGTVSDPGRRRGLPLHPPEAQHSHQHQARDTRPRTADALVRQAGLASADHRANQILTVQPTAGKDGENMNAHQCKHCVGEALVQFAEPVTADIVVGGPARSCQAARHQQQGDDSKRTSGVVANMVLRPPVHDAGQIAECGSGGPYEAGKPSVSRAHYAPHQSKADQRRHRVSECDVDKAPLLTFRGQVGTQEAQRQQPVKEAGRRIPNQDAAGDGIGFHGFSAGCGHCVH